VHCAGVPDAPKSVELTESMADGVILTVESPEEDGGMPVIGYRIHYGDDDRHDVTTSGTYCTFSCNTSEAFKPFVVQ